MNTKDRKDYDIEDFLLDDSFKNYHFRLNTIDELNWKKWLTVHPEKKLIVKQARELLQSLSLTISDREFRMELEKLKNAISKKPDKSLFQLLKWNRTPLLSRKTKRSFVYLSLAGLLFIGGAYFLLHSLRSDTVRLTETVNNRDKPLTIILSDSTVVTLNPHSGLRYPLHFQLNERNVYLQGEAQFHVKRNEHAPFKVFSENIVATVLGTTFNFKKSGDSSIVVELLNGKLNVAINDNAVPEKSILLLPNEKAVYVKQDKLFYKRTIAAPVDFYFHQNDFKEIAGQIQKAFGITVINESNKKKWRFTGEFKNTTARDVIENICLVKNLHAEFKRDTIFIK
jgi:ferric-dicitrate binding protein FerR (iron transport regulator)